jgi:Family of unknown function (DUF5406)
MTEVIQKYSPNTQWGKQVVEIILKAWGYSATFTEEVGGNCLGFDVIECAIVNLYDRLVDDGAEPTKVVLTNSSGDELLCEDDEDREEEWLKKMVVSARIVAWVAPTLNEVRAKNGAPPVADGDKPYDPR